MEEIFEKILDKIFNNWTALKLAVEHSLGGPNSVQVANEIKTYMIQFCLKNNVEADDVQEALDTIMDEEFETICEDNSTKEISIIIYRFIQLLKQNNLQQCEIEFNELPQAQVEWLKMPQCQQALVAVEDSDSSSETENEDTPMEEDSEWTVVKSRKKK